MNRRQKLLPQHATHVPNAFYDDDNNSKGRRRLFVLKVEQSHNDEAALAIC